MSRLHLDSPHRILRLLAERQPDGLFLIDPDRRIITYGEFYRGVALIRNRLISAYRVRPQQRVAIICRNSIAQLQLSFAVWETGGVTVPVNLQHRGASLDTLLRTADPALLVVDELGQVVLETGIKEPLGAVAWLDRLSEPVGEHESEIASPSGESAAMILFSSGTTGEPKGCVLSHDYLTWCGETFYSAGDLTPEDRVYSCNQFCHINAWWAFFGALVGGLPFVFDISFSASKFWDRVDTCAATVFDYVGVQIPILLKQDTSGTHARTLRAGLGGGTGAPAIGEFADRFGVKLLEAYGLTECCLPIFQRETEFRLGTMGRESRWVEARLVDELGVEVPADTPGNLVLRAREPRSMFTRYWRRPDLDSAAFSDGWFKTRDVCMRDRDGYFRYVGRSGDVIRSRGENVSPFELEAILLSHPAVSQCAVRAVPSLLGDEDILAVVTPGEGAVLAPGVVHDWCLSRVAAYMVPRYVVIGELAANSSGRVQRDSLDIGELLATATDFGRVRATR